MLVTLIRMISHTKSSLEQMMAMASMVVMGAVARGDSVTNIDPEDAKLADALTRHVQDLLGQAMDDPVKWDGPDIFTPNKKQDAPSERKQVVEKEVWEQLLEQKRAFEMVLNPNDCVFCHRISMQDTEGFAHFNDVGWFTPLKPVVPGHMLFVPRTHLVDASQNPTITGKVFQTAAEYAASQGTAFNLITSAGGDASQTVFHLHIHYVPRREGDGLQLPWSATHNKKLLVRKKPKDD